MIKLRSVSWSEDLKGLDHVGGIGLCMNVVEESGDWIAVL